MNLRSGISRHESMRSQSADRQTHIEIMHQSLCNDLRTEYRIRMALNLLPAAGHRVHDVRLGNRNIPVFNMTSPINQIAENKDFDRSNDPYGRHWESLCWIDEKLFLLSCNFSGATRDGYLTRLDAGSDFGTALNTVNPLLGTGSHLVATCENTLTCAFDNGNAVTFDSEMEEMARIGLHDEMVTGLISCGSGGILTSSSWDSSICQTDLREGHIKKKITNAHVGHVNSMDCKPSDDVNVCLSVGQDKAITVWDMRTVNAGHPFCHTTTTPNVVSFSAKDENHFYVGATDSTLSIFDLRNNRNELHSQTLSGETIRRLRMLVVSDHSIIAVICDNNKLTLLNEGSLLPIYSGSSSHSGWIRDVTVINNKIYTVGHDVTHLVEHQIQI